MATAVLLAQLDGDLTYTDTGAGGTGTGTGALRYRAGHTGGVDAALVEEGTVNYHINPSAEHGAADMSNSWGFTGSATRTKSTDQAADGTNSCKLVVSAVANSGAASPPSAQAPAATIGQAWTASFDIYGDGSDLRIAMVERNSSNTLLSAHDGSNFTAPASWNRYTYTYTLDQATTAKVNTYTRNVGADATTFYMDRGQLEQKDHATTFCPEYDGTGFTDADITTGYTVSAATGAEFDYYTRAAAKIELPLASAPASVAFRYRETETGAMGFDYIETLTGNNVGTYGKISHDGADLVIESDRLLVIGPVLAFSDTLTSGEQAALDAATTWTFDILDPTDPPVVSAGANASVAQNVTWTRSGSFTDADSASWTATVDYDDGGGEEVLTLDGFDFDLSYTWATPGTYTVVVAVTDNSGSTGTDSVTVTVTEAATAGVYLVSGVTGSDASAPIVTIT
jgi:hypothetical protein